MAVQSAVHPMTAFERNPLRTRVTARESRVSTLLVPAQPCSRNGSHYFAATTLEVTTGMTNRVMSGFSGGGDEYRFFRR